MTETREFPDDEPGGQTPGGQTPGGRGSLDDTPDATTDPEIDEVQAENPAAADPTASSREGLGMPAEQGSDDDPASYLNP